MLVLLLIANLDLKAFSEEEIRFVGIALDCGNVMFDRKTKKLWSIFHDNRAALNHLDVDFFEGRYSDVIPEIGASANDLQDSGRFYLVPVRMLARAPFSIKLSFNKDADYDSLPRSEDCPWQGYFYPDPSEENVQ